MRILLVSHGPADCNSSQHVFGFARGLTERGHEARVAVVDSVPVGGVDTSRGFAVGCLQTMVKSGARFSDGKSADLLHVWTPREPMRWFAEEYWSVARPKALVVHLEDNEEILWERFTGRPFSEAGRGPGDPPHLVHPRHYRSFLASAQGVTVIHRCLLDLVPGLNAQEMAPVMDFKFLDTKGPDGDLRRKLNLGRKTRVIAYNGNDHPAALADIRMLYDAVEELIHRGRDVALIRTGHVMEANYGGLRFRPGPRCCELGFIPREQIPPVLRLADICVQPGTQDEFNRYRLPSKIPEYLAMGKPLITGQGNIGSELAEKRGAIVLAHMTAPTLAAALESLLENPKEAARMGLRGQAFAQQRFAASEVMPMLESFYRHCIELGLKARESGKGNAP